MRTVLIPLLSLLSLAPLAAPATATGPCVPDDVTLCLDDAPGDRRFAVTVTFETVQGGGFAGSARAIPLDSLGVSRGGLFWFFSPDNPEVLVKVLNGCVISGHYWVYLTAGTNVGMVATVTDTVRGRSKGYRNPDLLPAGPIHDGTALACGDTP